MREVKTMGVLDIFRSKDNPGKIAKERLKLVLVSDRMIGVSSATMMENLRNDIIQVLSKYMDIDEMDIDLQITKAEGDTGHTLSANVPVKNLKKSSD